MPKTTFKNQHTRIAALLCSLVLSPGLMAAPFTIAGVSFDSDNATSNATITGGGYVTPFGTALHSGTSPDWSVADSLGTYFQVPTFQHNYNPSQATHGEAGSAVTLGQDEDFPQTSSNERDIIQLDWGLGQGLANQAGVTDLAVFEAATSEAFALRVHSLGTGGGAYWSAWYYTPYSSSSEQSALDNDTTPTLFDLDLMGLADGEIINALEITNLLIDDTLGTLIDEISAHGEVFFGGSSTPGEDNEVLRYSSSQSAFVSYSASKFDPDIQYVVGLHDLESGLSETISDVDGGAGLSQPIRFAPTDTGQASLPPSLALLLLALSGMALSRYSTAEQQAQ